MPSNVDHYVPELTITLKPPENNALLPQIRDGVLGQFAFSREQKSPKDLGLNGLVTFCSLENHDPIVRTDRKVMLV
jgi:hypothetical protein